MFDFLLRCLVYICAFAGAGWFIDWAREVDQWPGSFTVIVVVAVVGGVLVAYLRTEKPFR